jgi:hypothetical protein
MRIRRIIMSAALVIGVLAANVVTEESASAALAPTCNALTATANWSTAKSYTYRPGQWCMKDDQQEVIFQSDGNLVWYQTHYDQVKWATNTNAKGATKLSFQVDGNIVIYNSAGRALWAIGGAARRTTSTRFNWQLSWVFGCGGYPGSRDYILKHFSTNPDVTLHYRDVCGPA